MLLACYSSSMNWRLERSLSSLQLPLSSLITIGGHFMIYSGPVHLDLILRIDVTW